jgi:hypothetical protein
MYSDLTPQTFTDVIQNFSVKTKAIDWPIFSRWFKGG